MLKTLAIGVISFGSIAGGGYIYSIDQNQNRSGGAAVIRHINDSASVYAIAGVQQDPPQNPPQDPAQPPAPPKPEPKPEDDPDYQPGDTASHRYSPGDGCSRANPQADPGTKLNGVKKNTVGCECKPTCVNGQDQEDLSKGVNGKYICKNACHFDRCFCPDKCKT